MVSLAEGETRRAPPAGSFKRGGAGVNLGTPAPAIGLPGIGLPAPSALAYGEAMASERAMDAIGRIERALGRLDAVAARPAPPPPPPQDDGELLRLREAHQSLRGQVESVIGQIDGLIAKGETR
jgi:hypothetical protein